MSITRTAALVLALSSSAALAETTVSGRYSMTPTDGGFLRLDSVTGSVAVCTAKDSAWSCTATPDSLLALQSEIDRLAADNDRLETENEALKASAATAERSPLADLPSDAEIDRAMGFFEKVLRRFKTIVEDLKKEPAPGTQL